MAVYVLTIDGVARTLQENWNIAAPANGPGTMNFEVLSLDASYVPDLSDEVILTEDGTRIFGGVIKSTFVKGAGGKVVRPIVTEVTATDFNILATRRYFSGTLTGTLEDFLTVLVNYIDGATLSPSQVTGPTLESVTYAAWKVSDVLDQISQLTGYVWEVNYEKVLSMYLPGTRNAPFVVTATNGYAEGDLTAEDTNEQYANRVYVYGTGVTAIAEDTTEVANNGAYEYVVQSLDITTQAPAEALADAILAAQLPTLKRVKYRTHGAGILPGQIQNITLPGRTVNGTYLITEVTVQSISAKHVRRYVTAVEGQVYRTGWRETVRSWGGVGATQTAGLNGGGGGGVPFLRNAYFLGGTGNDYVRSSIPDWVFASAIQASVNTVTRGTTDAVVYARLRALEAGVSVQARLYDVTDQSACPGVSAVVTSTDWTLVTFNVTLTAGAHYYQLQVLPGTANKDVGAVGYIE